VTDDGWNESASAWLSEIGAGGEGDWSRVAVLDAPMLARVDAGGFTRALDVGCGEGRFSRMLRARGIETIGVEPTKALREAAQQRDPNGAYVEAVAEKLPFEDASFDLAVSYLTLIDIPDYRAAFREMTRVLRPGGALLIANINSFISAGNPDPLGWQRKEDGTPIHFALDGYLDERADWVAWREMRILNWHRPLSDYMKALLGNGLVLTHFDEPAATEDPFGRSARHRRAPWFLVMEWRKPE